MKCFSCNFKIIQVCRCSSKFSRSQSSQFLTVSSFPSSETLILKVWLLTTFWKIIWEALEDGNCFYLWLAGCSCFLVSSIFLYFWAFYLDSDAKSRNVNPNPIWSINGLGQILPFQVSTPVTKMTVLTIVKGLHQMERHVPNTISMNIKWFSVRKVFMMTPWWKSRWLLTSILDHVLVIVPIGGWGLGSPKWLLLRWCFGSVSLLAFFSVDGKT